MLKIGFDLNATIETTRLIARKSGDRIRTRQLNNLLYLADRALLAQGIPGTGDQPISRPDGPVLETLALLCTGKGAKNAWNRSFRIQGSTLNHAILTLREPAGEETIRTPLMEQAKKIHELHGNHRPGKTSRFIRTHCAEWQPGQRPNSEILHEDILRAQGKTEDEATQCITAILETHGTDAPDHPALRGAAAQLAAWNQGHIHARELNAILYLMEREFAQDPAGNHSLEALGHTADGPITTGAWNLCQGIQEGLDPKPLQDWKRCFRMRRRHLFNSDKMNLELTLRHTVESGLTAPQTEALGRARDLFNAHRPRNPQTWLAQTCPEWKDVKHGATLNELLIAKHHPKGDQALEIQQARLDHHRIRRNENSRED